MNEGQSRQWFDPLFRPEAMRAVFSDRARLQGILDFEAALARAQAQAGVIPTDAAATITHQCRAELFDLSALANASQHSGNSAIPVVNALTQLVAAADAHAARYVHSGATSQDAMDTGLVLQMRKGLDLLETQGRQLAVALRKLALAEKETPIAGRTWLQHAAPTTFGYKAASYLDAVVRHLERIREVRSRALVLQLGGAVGNRAALGDHAEKIAALLSQQLHLPQPTLPWHSHRDRPAEIATSLGLLTGTLGKIAHDLSLLMQSEIGEVAEPAAPGKGGSSSMPQKRNPVNCAVILSAAARVPGLVATLLAIMPQEHERGLGNWHAEWETIPEIFMLCAGALFHSEHLVAGLQVDRNRMRANLELTGGLIYAESLSTALAKTLGHDTAHRIVQQFCRRAFDEKRGLLEVASKEPQISAHLSPASLQQLFSPEAHMRAAATLVDAAILATDLSLKKLYPE